MDTNGQIGSPQETRTHSAWLLAADQTWEHCNPARCHPGEKAAGSLDSRGMAENKERDEALAQSKFCQELVLQGMYLHGIRKEEKKT